jgi:hypothetical protein
MEVHPCLVLCRMHLLSGDPEERHRDKVNHEGKHHKREKGLVIEKANERAARITESCAPRPTPHKPTPSKTSGREPKNTRGAKKAASAAKTITTVIHGSHSFSPGHSSEHNG